METLNRILRRILVIAIVVIPAFGQVHAQNGIKVLEDAFEKSYNYEVKSDWTNAISVLKEVYDEKSYEINLRLGWLDYNSGAFTESSSYYQNAVNLKPYAIEAKLGLVLPASALGNWNLVVSQYEEILKIDPQNTLVNYRMASIEYGKQDYASAEKHLEKVVNLYPFDYDSNILFAWTKLKLGKFGEAQVLFHKALLMRPQDSSALDGLRQIK